MKKYYIIAQLAILIIAFILIGKNVIPTKVDIEYLEVVEIIGMDEYEDSVNVSVLLKSEQNAGGEGGKEEPNSSKSSGKVLTVSSTTYSQAMDIVRTVTEKYIIINHTKYYIVGEETAKNNLKNIVDFLARTDETIVTAKVLVAEGMSAEDFLNKVNEDDMDIVKSLEEAALDINAKNFTTNTTIIDLVDMFLQSEIVGVVPCISVLSNDIDQFSIKISEGEAKQSETFGYKTIGIIQDMKLVDKISLKQVEAFNIVKGDAENIVVLIRPSEQEKFVLTCDVKESNIKFETIDNEIQKMKINLKYECDIEEAQTTEKLFTLEQFEKFQNMTEEIIKKEVEQIINKSLKDKLDFMNLQSVFERQHPYIFRNIKDKFLETLNNAKIEINVNCSINNTFDVMQSNKYQKGDEET